MRALSVRQEVALDAIRARPGIDSHDLGAIVHEATGKHGGSRREVCTWCSSDGRQIALALKKKGLIRAKGRGQTNWYPLDVDEQLAIGARVAEPDPFPEGF